jgi:uncharacterized protein YbjT (DUF2867 family)
MVGQGVLRECLLDSAITQVLVIGRTAVSQEHPKITQLVLADVAELEPVKEQLRGYGACFFCLGVSSGGMKEEDYRRLTYTLTLKAAQTLAETSPEMTFIYVSGSGTDSSERGGTMWARVKGATENALLRLPFKAVYLFRPGVIQPLHGIVSKTKSYRLIYTFGWPLISLMKLLAPAYVTTTERLGRAMIKVARDGAPKKHLENRDINAL